MEQFSASNKRVNSLRTYVKASQGEPGSKLCFCNFVYLSSVLSLRSRLLVQLGIEIPETAVSLACLSTGLLLFPELFLVCSTVHVW